MSVILGSGEHRYSVVENWAKLPDGWDLKDVAAADKLFTATEAARAAGEKQRRR